MPKYNVEATFDLETSIEPEGVGSSFDLSGIDCENVNDESYFSSQNVECDGGHIIFEGVSADDEDDARSKAEEVVFDGQEVEDSNGFTWVLSNVDFTVEAVEMDFDQAREVLTRLADEQGDEVAEAIKVVFDHIDGQDERISSLVNRLDALQGELNQLRQELAAQATQATPDTPSA